MVTLHEVITFLVSMQISISSLQTHNVNRCRSEERFSRNAETDLVCRLLLEKNMISVSHQHRHPFMSTDAVINLSRAGFTDQDILGIAQQDKLDTVSGDAVTLRLTGLSNSVVLAILNRQQRGRRTMSGPQIAELMNTGLTENQILERINRGMTDAEADREIAARKRARNQTGFKRNYGRRRY